MELNNPFCKYEYIEDKDKEAEAYTPIPPLIKKAKCGKEYFVYHKKTKAEQDPIIKKTIENNIKNEKYEILEE